MLSSYALPTLSVNLLNTGTVICYSFNLLALYLGQISNNVDLM